MTTGLQKMLTGSATDKGNDLFDGCDEKVIFVRENKMHVNSEAESRQRSEWLYWSPDSFCWPRNGLGKENISVRVP
jgi:hypothetical protein